MDAQELFPGEPEVREMATRAGWSPTVGNGFAAVFASPEDEKVTLRAYASFFEADVTPAFLVVETLEGDPQRAPLGLQLWVGTRDGRVPAPEEAVRLLHEHGVVCRVGGAHARGPGGGGVDPSQRNVGAVTLHKIAVAVGIYRTTPYNQATVGIYETYSKRLRKRERAGQPDVYQYDELPESLRVQVIHIWRDVLGAMHTGGGGYSASKLIWDEIYSRLAKEKGVFVLGRHPDDPVDEQCEYFLLNASTEDALDIIEYAFRLISMRDKIWAVSNSNIPYVKQGPKDAIDELNHRFREHGVGYQFEGGEILRVDSLYLHAEAVKPAISLLNTAGFKGPSEEFLEAHEHYRTREYADAIADALKAFESTMKAICDENGWAYNKGKDTAKDLIKTVLDNDLVPRYMETHLAGVRSSLGAGLPTVRNKLGGHGQGKEPRKVPDYFAGYALHLAATNIVFLVEAHQALNKT